MKRREFLKSTMLLAAVSTVVGKVSSVLAQAPGAAGAAAGGGAGKGAWPDEGGKFLGFQKVSKFKPTKMCSTCKYYKENKDAGANAGECTLPAMKNAVKNNKKAPAAFVGAESYCNMWQKKA